MTSSAPRWAEHRALARLAAALALAGAAAWARAAGPSTASDQAPPPRLELGVRLEGGINGLAFSPDGQRLAASSRGGQIRVWDVARRAPLRTPRGLFLHTLLMRVAWDAHPDRLLIQQSSAMVYDLERDEAVVSFHTRDERTGNRVAPLHGWPGRPWVGEVTCHAALFDEQGLARERLSWPAGIDCVGTIEAFLPAADGRDLVAVTAGDGAVVWARSDQGRPRHLPVDGFVKGAARSPDGAHLLLAVRRSEAPKARVILQPLAPGEPARVLFEDSDTPPDELAFSPDGRLAVVGGANLTVYQVDTGAVRWTLDMDRTLRRGGSELGDGLATAVAWSPDGRTLAVGNGRGDVLLLDAATGVAVSELGVGVRRPHRLHFSRGGRELVTTAMDGIARWSLEDGRLIGARRVMGAALTVETAPGKLLVVRSPVTLFAFADWRRLCRPERPGRAGQDDGEEPPAPQPVLLEAWDRGVLASLRADGARGLVLAEDDGLAGAKRPGRGLPNPLCVPGAFEATDADAATGRVLVRLEGQDAFAVHHLATGRTVPLAGSEGHFDTRLGPGHALAVGTKDGTALLWDTSTGRIRHRLTIPEAGETPALAATLSPDGRQVLLRAGMPPSIRTALSVHDTATGARRWALAPEAFITAQAFLPDGRLLVGTQFGELGLFRDGRLEAAATAEDGRFVFTLEVSADGRRAASSHVDGGVRVWSLPKLVRLATLVEFQDDEWAALTPSGAYRGTAEGMARLAWAFERPLQVFSASQFGEARRPDLVRASLAGCAVTLEPPARPPVLTAEAEAVGAQATLRIGTGGTSPVALVAVFAEGKPAASGRPDAAGLLTLEVPLGHGPNRLTVTAVDERGLAAAPVVLDVAGPPAVRRPTLWVVAAGVDAYLRLPKAFQLTAAEADARAVAAAFAAQAGPDRPFEAARVQVLTGPGLTVASLDATLRGLAAMEADDLAVVFLAGHGVRPRGADRMVFLTGEATWTAAPGAPGHVAWEAISARLAGARGKVLLLLDACHAGQLAQDEAAPAGALVAGLAREGRGGALVFAASKGRQVSLERDGQGVFTRALLAALASPATDRDGDGAVQVSELVEAVTVAVDGESRGEQTPWVARRETFGDYRVAAAARR